MMTTEQIDHAELTAVKDAVRAVIDTWDPLRRKIAYFALHASGERIDGIEHEIEKLSPRVAK